MKPSAEIHGPLCLEKRRPCQRRAAVSIVKKRGGCSQQRKIWYNTEESAAFRLGRLKWAHAVRYSLRPGRMRHAHNPERMKRSALSAQNTAGVCRPGIRLGKRNFAHKGAGHMRKLAVISFFCCCPRWHRLKYGWSWTRIGYPWAGCWRHEWWERRRQNTAIPFSPAASSFFSENSARNPPAFTGRGKKGIIFSG